MSANTNIQRKDNVKVEHGRLGELPAFLAGQITIEYWNQLTREQKLSLESIRTLPAALQGVVPESIWDTLEINQKLEFLFEKNLLPRVEIAMEVAPTQPEIMPVTSEIGGEVLVQGQTETEKEFAELVTQAQEVGGPPEIAQETPTVEDTAPVTNPKSAEIADKLVGYKPSNKTLNNIEGLLNDSPEKATTWTTNILDRLWKMLVP